MPHICRVGRLAGCAVRGLGGGPVVDIPVPNLVAAGDTVRTGLPVALTERAATSGFLAANALPRRWGLRGHALWTVPGRGRVAALRWAAARTGDRGRGLSPRFRTRVTGTAAGQARRWWRVNSFSGSER